MEAGRMKSKPVYPVRESRRLLSAVAITYLQIVVQSHNLSSLENLFSNGVYRKDAKSVKEEKKIGSFDTEDPENGHEAS
jgi:hypothetical protein